MLGTISLDLFAVLLGGATALLPVFARDILHAGPIGLGLLRTAPAIGAVAMSLLARRAFLLKTRNVGKTMLWAVGIFGAATIVFAVSTNLVLSVLMLLVLGASDTISVVVRTSLVQLLTPDGMRGRVNAINSLFIGTSNQLGEFESGLVAAVDRPRSGRWHWAASARSPWCCFGRGVVPRAGRKVETLRGRPGGQTLSPAAR